MTLQFDLLEQCASTVHMEQYKRERLYYDKTEYCVVVFCLI